jgi:arabinogalactan oligomer / maltooligosaccharide transport system substrate-binding protein
MRRILTIVISVIFLLLLGACGTDEQNTTANSVILLNGEAEVTLMVGEVYEEKGAVAIDGTSFLDVTITGAVDTSKPGTYVILYQARDRLDLLISVNRVVVIQERIEPPIIDESEEFEDESIAEDPIIESVEVTCNVPNGNDPCWNNAARRFLIEPNASITIGVDNDLLGEALVARWNRDFPSLSGLIVFRHYGSINGEQTGAQGLLRQRNLAPDVVLIVTNEVIRYESTLLPLHPYFEDLIASDSLRAVNNDLNSDAPIFLTAFWDGMSFSWNETMLRQLGVDVDTDSNGDGLPDAINSWEKIFELGLVNRTYKGNRILEVFPISLDEPWSGYSSVSSTGFVIFQQGADRPGFETPQFLGGLEFIQAFSRAGINLDETGAKKAASAMGWRWDQYLNDEAYPFGLVGTWMNVQAAQQGRGATFRFSAMPTWQGNPLRPLSTTKGFGVNAFTRYPSAAHEVLRWLYTPSTMSSMIANSSYLPALQEGAFSTPVITDRIKREFTNGMRLNQLVPIQTLPNNPSTSAMDLYYSIGITDFYKAVWDGTLTPAQAQEQIVSASRAWLSANN